MKRPSDLLRKKPFLALGTPRMPAAVPAGDVDAARAVWRTCFAHLAAGGLINRSSAYPLGLTAHFLIRSVERDPTSGTALSVAALHRTMVEEYRPAFEVMMPAFAVDIARWGSVAGYAVQGDRVLGARARRPSWCDTEAAAYVEALATLAT